MFRRKVLLSDTVGFISDLPVQVIEEYLQQLIHLINCSQLFLTLHIRFIFVVSGSISCNLRRSGGSRLTGGMN